MSDAPLDLDCAEMVKRFLSAEGYDGLVSEDGECACEISGDFMFCGGGDLAWSCVAGHKAPCRVDPEEVDPDEDGAPPYCPDCNGYHIAAGKAPAAQGGEGE